MTRPLRAGGVYETVLYGSDVPALAAFYAEIVGLRSLETAADGLFAACRTPDGGVLLLFDPAMSAVEGRTVPSHGASGPGHVAFTVGRGERDAWRERLREAGVPIEREVQWSPAAVSIYVRDPAGNSVEFVDGEIWE